MSRFAAALFTRVQAADFYRDTYENAVRLLPAGQGRLWVDVGCGPGLVACLASERGYDAVGLDVDPEMIACAKGLHGGKPNAPRFEVAGIELLPSRRPKADVISAASLLVVVRDRPAALRQLLAGLADDGALLVIEPDARMTLGRALALLMHRRLGKGAAFLCLWAFTRDPSRAVRRESMEIEGYRTERYELLDGLVNGWVLRRA